MRLPGVLFWLLLACCTSAQAGGERVALVIGAGAYKEAPALKNPPQDAEAIADALRELGFNTDLVIDPPDRATVERAVRTLGNNARTADAAVFFYAGHALEFGGRNYLVPVGASIRAPQDLPFEVVDLDLIASQLEGRARVIVLFLDACRDNPFARRIAESTRGLTSRGLSMPTSTATGTLIAYATAPGQTAADGVGTAHSPFTTALLNNIKIPGLEVRQLLARVRKEVREGSKGQQVPWESSALEGEFYFAPPVSAAPSTTRPAEVAVLNVPPPPSPAQLARSQALAVPCSVLNAQASGDALLVSGQALAGKELDLFLNRVKATARVTEAVEKLDRAHCQAVELLAAYVRQNRDSGTRVAIRPDRQRVAGGSTLGMTLEIPADATVYLDMYAGDGSVRHLLRDESRKAQPARADWLATALPGRRLIVALAPRVALDLGSRAETENASAYLAVLKRALQRTADQSMPLADIAIVEVLGVEPAPAAAKRPPEAQTAKPSLKSARCAGIVERAQLGEPLSDGDRTALAECRS